MVVVKNAKMNESRAASYAAAPVTPNVLNYVLTVGGSLSMGFVENTKMNEALADAYATAPAAVDTTIVPSSATSNAPTAAATPNVPALAATVDALAEADT